MTIEELKQSNGNVCKIKHGLRTAYYAYKKNDIFSTIPDILGVEVSKKGFIKRSKNGLVHEYVFNISEVLEVVDIHVSEKF